MKKGQKKSFKGKKKETKKEAKKLDQMEAINGTVKLARQEARVEVLEELLQRLSEGAVIDVHMLLGMISAAKAPTPEAV